MAEAKKPAVKKAMGTTKKIYYIGTGRRKESVARVRITPTGTGKIIVNDKELDKYFSNNVLKLIVNQPLELTNMTGKIDIFVNVNGGGLSGQAGAIRHGISRALIKLNEGLKPELKKAGFLTRDPRAKERKKYGLKKARKAPTFTKR